MRIFNLKDPNRPAQAWLIDRNTPFGNPFVIGKDGTREEVIAKYKRYFWERINNDPKFRAMVEVLEGGDLICHCAPLPCHGDVIVAWFEAGQPLKED